MNYKVSIRDVRFLLPLLFLSILISCTANKKVSDNLKNKEVFTKGFPITLSFRADKFGMNDGYEAWENSYLSVNSITKKYLTEEVDMDPIIAEYANRFAESHPEKLMLLHLNGEGMSIKSKEIHKTFFPGHWIYESGTIPMADINETQNEIVVETAKPFSERAYIIHGAGRNLGTLPHDLIIVETDSIGNRLWDKYEYVTIEKVDDKSNSIKVKRGQYFTQPRSFSKGKTYIAPLAGASWGGNLMWYYNLSSTCPKDENGKNCADIFLDLIKGWFAEDGILKNLDGIGYDVNYFVSDHKTWDCNNDGVADKGIVNGMNVWREGDWRFLQELRAHFGPDFIITADGWRDEMQRAVGLLNGMETEGLCRPNDGYRQISRTINQHIYWNMYNDSKYKFSYITSKLNNPADVKIGTQLRRMGIGLASCLGVAYTTLPEQMPEANGGTLNKPNWLGQTKSDIIFPAKETPDLLQGAGVSMSESLIKQFDFKDVIHKVEDGVLSIKGTKDDPYAEIRVEGPAINLPKGDLVVFFEAKAIEGYKDFKQTDRVPRKVNIRINGLPVSTLTNDSNMYLSMHNDLSGFMGTSGFTPLSFYFRNVGNDSTPIQITIEAEEQGEFAIRNLTVQNAPCTVAREFQNGVVLVNPSFDAVNFNLSELFPGIKKLRRINAEKVGRGTSVSDSTEIFNHNNGEEITDLSNVTVSGLNALFLVIE